MSDPLADLARLEGVPSAVGATRDAIDVVVADRGLRQVAPELTVRALVAGARASADLSAQPERWLPGCLRLATELMALSALVRVAPGQVLARTHALVAAGTLPVAAVGRLQDSSEVGERIPALNRLLVTKTAAPGLVLAAVAHGELATLQPFGEIDDIIARAVERMLLIATGVDPYGVVVSEAGHAHRVREYRQALAGYAGGSAAGVRRWLLHCLTAYATGAAMASAPPSPRSS